MFSNTRFPVHEDDGYTYLDLFPSDGEPRQTLLFLHGMFGGLSNFDALAAHMRESDCRIVVPRIPLYSRSRADLTIPQLAGWVLGFMDHLSLTAPMVLGNSMGGHIALELARRCPGRAEALVLTGSSGLMEEEFGTTFPKRSNREYIRRQASLTFYEDLVDERMIDEIQEVVLDARKMVRLLSLARETRNYHMEKMLPDIPHRTLLVWGRQDRITPPEVGESFARLMPAAELRWINRCGHAPMMERPAEFARHLEDFLIQTVQTESTHEEDYSHI
ncbi:MAG: alpha/beta fold hydrolase [Balneolaceae bacterium]|nr:alpha/beta fold hydrolase [Balneolaceae bacterium]